MTIKQIAKELHQLLGEQKFFEIYNDLFHPTEVEHFESKAQAENYRYLKGVNAIKAKSEAFIQMVSKAEGPELGDPIIMSSAFAIPYTMHVELKDGFKFTLEEIIVYEVSDGKIVKEHIFY